MVFTASGFRLRQASVNDNHHGPLCRGSMSLEESHICVVNSDGKRLKEAKVFSEPETLIAWFAAFRAPMARIELEAGPLS